MEGHQVSKLFTLAGREARKRFPYSGTGVFEGICPDTFGICVIYSDHGHTCKTSVLIRWDELIKLLDSKATAL